MPIIKNNMEDFEKLSGFPEPSIVKSNRLELGDDRQI